MSESTAPAAVETAEPTNAPDPKLLAMDIQQIMALIPHRYPFLLIDRIVEMERKVRLVAIKNVTANEPQFTGHFPDHPIMPGVLTIEAMAQAGAVLLLSEIADRENKLVLFTGIDEAKFRRPVTPGDQLRIEVETIQWSSRMSKMKGTCLVNGKVAAQAIITCQIVPRARKGAEGTTEPAGSGE
ncbi:3-hydroxyacyl-ACP dehydratase FabZ [Granulicella sp. 5B5]|uniref:3-hydroxyacyl-ACP dehydratase FabZ n=1 Tax=Granulicella sp. 5B5 TaxID=1617967 RepID=UPI0015F3D1F6|nr:3-hydroxyacyl-ACP dehydratase FabZ [Granulicella sp. 5B5]QMV18654.1 3-hydroxyacyl-ACP dehydratase FabZ [Granulicella sp. 5B5]